MGVKAVPHMPPRLEMVNVTDCIDLCFQRVFISQITLSRPGPA